MAGQYLEIYPQETYSYTTNVTLDNAAQELSTALLWFVAYSFDCAANSTPFINLNSAVGNIAVSNGSGSNVNSVVTISIGSDLTANLGYVNSGGWALVGQISGRVYTLDHGQIAVVPRVGPACISFA